MILLDTHVWVWLCHADGSLPADLHALIEVERAEGLCVSAISLWEVAKLVELKRLELPLEIAGWLDMALDASGVAVIPLTPDIAVASTRLPGDFHRDPADQIIVATARTRNLPLVTCDRRILAYPHVPLLATGQIHDR